MAIGRPDPTLSSTETLYRALVESSSEMIVLVDDDGRVAFVNGACAELLGYERCEMLGRELSDFFALDADTWVALEFASRDRNRVSLRRELSAVRKSGGRVDVAFSAAPIRDDNAHQRSIVAVISDANSLGASAAEPEGLTGRQVVRGALR